MPATKEEQYRDLVDARKRCRACRGLRNPAKGRFSLFDSDHIGPWTRLEGDLDAHLMVVGQDWGDVRYYVENLGGDLRPNQTDVNLATLLQSVGFCGPLVRNNAARGLFLTNSVLCLKRGEKRGQKRRGMQARVKEEWVDECGRRFLRSQIELVKPRVVVAMGRMAYRAALAAFDVDRPWPTLRKAVENQDGRPLGTASTLLAVYHCSAQVLNNKKGRSWDQQLHDWQRVAKALALPRSSDDVV